MAGPGWLLPENRKAARYGRAGKMIHSIGQDTDGYRFRFESLPPPWLSPYPGPGELSPFPGRLPLCPLYPPAIKVKSCNCDPVQSIQHQINDDASRRKTPRRNGGRSTSLAVQRLRSAHAIYVSLNLPGDPGRLASPRGRRIHAVFGKFLASYGASPVAGKVSIGINKLKLRQLWSDSQ